MTIRENPVVRRCDGVPLCDLCLDGAGGECHTPGCIMWLNRAPDLAIREKIILFGGTVEGETKTFQQVVDEIPMELAKKIVQEFEP